MVKTISLMLLRIIILIPIYICKGFFKVFKLGIYMGSFIALSIGNIFCIDPNTFEIYKNSKTVKLLSELLGFSLVMIIILSVCNLISYIIK